ncbi:MAG TPA: ABC transporter permease [Pseudonocardiaceae bacterium]|nr:ABC transporter permease [Pseudonocardiaceae bacterium]
MNATRVHTVDIGPRSSWLPRPLWRAVQTVWSNRMARVGVVILGVLVLVAVFAPLLAPYSPTDTDFGRSVGPGAAHWLGTTGSGQDAFSRLLYGARVSLVVAFAAGILSTVIAIAVGLFAGYLVGLAEETINFVVNLFLVVPALPLMIVIATYSPSRGVGVIVLVVVLTGWAWGARVLRAQTATLRGRDFVAAAEFSGERPHRIVFREILPNMTSLVAASFLGAATAAVLGEAGLEFLGLGNPNTISWGTMLFWAQNDNALLVGQWPQILAPGLAIALLAASLSLINFGVDALSNPRLREGVSR